MPYIYFFYVYVFECFILVELCKLIVKTVCKFAYKLVLVAICIRSIASKALKGFIYVFVLFCSALKWQNAGIIYYVYNTKGLDAKISA